jgi:putative tryptophan/tyrosine transport system substrate-binding protein
MKFDRRRFCLFSMGSLVASPLAVQAQQRGRVRRVGVFMQIPERDPEARARVAALVNGLSRLGWEVGRNIQIDFRSAIGREQIRTQASELLALNPDVVLAVPSINVRELQRQTSTIPLIFVNIGDPIAAGLLSSLSRPGRNTTGFHGVQPSIAGKWTELLKEMVPDINRLLVIRNEGIDNAEYLKVIEGAAAKLGMEVSSAQIDVSGDIDRAIATFTKAAKGGGLIATPGGPITVHRKLVFAAAATHRLPAIYSYPYYSEEGGLAAYGPSILDQWRRAASYVDRIFKGEKPGDLPVQMPTKYELVINRKTATALGLAIPQTVLLQADKVIE